MRLRFPVGAGLVFVVHRERLAILIDGGHVIASVQQRHHRVPTANEVVALCIDLVSRPQLAGSELYRAFFYHARPLKGRSRNPLTGQWIRFSERADAPAQNDLMNDLAGKPNFAVREGKLKARGWGLKKRALKRLLANLQAGQPLALTGNDLRPSVVQKAVDMRIGLDVATLALKKQVSAVMLVTGDTDFVPAMKVARREGLRVYLHTMPPNPVHPELRAHADHVL